MEISDPYLKYKYIVKKWENEFIKIKNRNPKKVISVYKFITISYIHFNIIMDVHENVFEIKNNLFSFLGRYKIS